MHHTSSDPDQEAADGHPDSTRHRRRLRHRSHAGLRGGREVLRRGPRPAVRQAMGNMPAGEFETGNLTIAVMQSDAFGLEFKPHTHPIALHVDDFEAARAELESRGVEFKGETIDSGVASRRSSRIRTATRSTYTTATRPLARSPGTSPSTRGGTGLVLAARGLGDPDAGRCFAGRRGPVRVAGR